MYAKKSIFMSRIGYVMIALNKHLMPYGHNIRYLFNFKQYLNLELKVALKCLSSISMLLTQQTEFRAYT